MKFDKVIMNPPYSIGGDILDKAKKVSKNIICLMPLAQYKKYKRYKYIASLEIADMSLFDASIIGNLCIYISYFSCIELKALGIQYFQKSSLLYPISFLLCYREDS